MDKRQLRKRIKTASANVLAEMASQSRSGCRIAAGLSSEGYAGGYLAALHDVQALMDGWEPDQSRYMRKPQP